MRFVSFARCLGIWLAMGTAAAQPHLVPTPPALPDTIRAHVLDVGQGSAAILETECAAILVDAGGEHNNEFDSTQSLVDQIEEFFFGRPHLKRTFELVVLTHPHVDHTRGVQAIVDRYRIRNVVTNGQETGSGKAGQKALHRLVALSEESDGTPLGFEPIRVSDLPDSGLSNEVVNPIACGHSFPQITALWGTSDTAGWTAKDAANQNNHSVVLRVDFGSSSILLTGDLEDRGIQGLLKRYRNTSLLDADVYFVGHHGAANATTDALMRAVTPKVAVISMGAPDRETSWTAWAYGHPRKIIVQRLIARVADARTPRNVTVATGQRTFEQMPISRAIYATGWDGSFVLEGNISGDWRLVGASVTPMVATPRDPVANPSGPRKIDINSASADELDTLPMIGLNRAKKIVAFREANGPFTSIDELTQVPGIGVGTLKAVRRLTEARQPD